MSRPFQYNQVRYLVAKKSVDDRALNSHVWRTLINVGRPAFSEEPFRILEVGAGIGTMVERLVEWGLFPRPTDSPLSADPDSPAVTAEVTAIDADRVCISEAHNRLSRWAVQSRFDVIDAARHLQLQQPGLDLKVELEATDLFEFAERERERRKWDLLIAHAFLDLIDIAATLPVLFSLLQPNGLFYFTITLDGGTILQPEIDRAFDDLIEMFYHHTMDERLISGKRSGDSRAGRHLFHILRAAGAQVLDVGSSDWVVFPRTDGYAADEAYFLHYIIETLDRALRGHPQIDARRFTQWVGERHAQIDRAELVYIAHQLDLLGRAP
jgi:hypothetical protein